MASIISFYDGDTNPYNEILDSIKLRFPSVIAFQIQTDRNTDMAEKYNIKVNPTMILLSDSIEYERYEGRVSYDVVMNDLKNLLGDPFMLLSPHKNWGDDDD